MRVSDAISIQSIKLLNTNIFFVAQICTFTNYLLLFFCKSMDFSGFVEVLQKNLDENGTFVSRYRYQVLIYQDIKYQILNVNLIGGAQLSNLILRFIPQIPCGHRLSIEAQFNISNIKYYVTLAIGTYFPLHIVNGDVLTERN